MSAEKPPKIVASESPEPAKEWNEMNARGEFPPDPETSRTYENIDQDPALKEVEDRVQRLSTGKSPAEIAIIEQQQWGAFVKTHPEKVEAYKERELRIQKEVERENARRSEIAAKLHTDAIALEEVKARLAANTAEEPPAQEPESESTAPVESANLAEASSEKMPDAKPEETPASTPESVEPEPTIEAAAETSPEGGPETVIEAGPENPEGDSEGQKEGGEETASDTQAENKGEKKEKKSWVEKTGMERMKTIGRWSARLGGTAAAVGLGVAGNAALFGTFGAAPATAGIGLSAAGLWAGAGFVGSMVMMDILGWNLIKNLWVDGKKWLGGIIGSSGSGPKATAKAPAGGGGHGPAH